MAYNKSLEKNIMPVQAPDERIKNFDEVALGYTAEIAVDEAERCLGCKRPTCVEGCPVGIDIPGFIAKIQDKDFEAAYSVIAKDSSLPAVCGRVCPQETQCEQRCVRGKKGEPVAIGRLERFVADVHNANTSEESASTSTGKDNKNSSKKIAVIGSGPAGLACASELAHNGADVTIFEALHTPGGVLVYGIPEFRLPKAIVQREIEGLKKLGVKIRTNIVVGKTITIDELMDEEGFDDVFIGSGAGLPKFMNIPGENLIGVLSANEFLTRINLMKAYRKGANTPTLHPKRVCVVGGGNVAMDAARCARRLGAEVTIVYRRTKAELPARAEEVEHAVEEGIVFHMLASPIEVLGDDTQHVSGIVCQNMELGEPDASGRRRPVPIEGKRETIECDCMIMALGTSPNPLIRSTTEGLDTQKWGGIIADEETGKTSREGVYAGGDAVTGAATVILAMGAGKAAAKAML